MAYPTLSPVSQVSAIVLPSTGSASNVTGLPIGVYSDTNSPLYSTDFVSGCVDQVAVAYTRLGGQILDIELTENQVYAAYEEATLEYSNIINLHQAKNTLPNVLGNMTGTFDHDGHLKSGALSSSLSGSSVALKYPKYDITYAYKVASGFGTHARAGGDIPEYSASISLVSERQDYDLQTIVYNSSLTSSSEFYNKLSDNQKILVTKVYYKTGIASWSFYGSYPTQGGFFAGGGGLGMVGNYGLYNSYANNTTFEITPSWVNKLQAMAFEDSIYTRCSHYSYELINNKIRLFPIPNGSSLYPSKIWFKFIIPDASNAWDPNTSGGRNNANGINNLNTLPFGNIPYNNINAIGKQWIRRFALAICKEILGQIRGKYGGKVPIPGQDVSLNATELLSQAKEEMKELKEELNKTLEELTYVKLQEAQAAIAESSKNILKNVPNLIYVM